MLLINFHISLQAICFSFDELLKAIVKASMRNIQCLFIGNTPQTFKAVLEYTIKIPWLTVVCKPVNPREARHYLQEFDIDILFCDVATVIEKEMEAFLLNNRARLQVIVLATKTELSENDILCNVFSFLPRPVSFEKFYNTVCRAREYLQPGKEKDMFHLFDFVFIKSEYKYYRVKFDEILFCEGMKDYTQVYLANKPKPIITLQNLKNFIAKLPKEGFIRVHRSYVVSLGSIDVISKNDIVIGQKFIPIGESYRSNLFRIVEQSS
ncbi:MAG: DNA-binding response regulator [Ferruginibacter sp.]|nr:DNA-binding response regulator [Ferruginibacter sp.]